MTASDDEDPLRKLILSGDNFHQHRVVSKFVVCDPILIKKKNFTIAESQKITKNRKIFVKK
jgi:hypothetical protein